MKRVVSNVSLRLAAVLIAILLPGGCQTRSDSGAAGANDPSGPWLKVITDPVVIDRARKASRDAESERVERIFRALGEPFFIDNETIEQVRSQRDRTVPRLIGMLPKAGVTNESVGATVILCQLREDAGRSFATRILGQGTHAQRLRLLGDIDAGVYEETETRNYREFLFTDPDLISALLAQLDDSDPAIVKAAVQCCGYLNVPGAHERFQKLLRQPNAPDTDRLLFWLSKGELTEELFQLAVDADAKSVSEVSWGASIFEAFAASDSEALRSRAKDQLRAVLANWPEEGLIGFDGNRLGILDALSRAADEYDLDWLLKLVETERGMYAVAPLAAYIRLSPERGRKLLLAWLATEDRRKDALSVITSRFTDTQDEELIGLLDQAASRAKDAELASICGALISLGGKEMRHVVAKYIDRLEPASAAPLRARLNPSSRDEIIETLRTSGILSAEEIKAALEKLSIETSESPSPGLFEILLISGHALVFDVETGMLPCRHDQLIREFASATGGRFAPEALLEVWNQRTQEDFDAPYTLQFVVSDRLYRGTIRNLGDWYDVDRVVAMINLALTEQGIPERFLSLDTEGQEALFVFADPERLSPIAKKFEMPLSTDLDAARRQGIEFEEKVKKQLEDTLK